MRLKITKFKNVKSTNDKAIKLIRNNRHNSGLIVAEMQTKGRGTMGKKWISKKGNIFISIFFKVNFNKFRIDNFLMINVKIIKKILKSYTKKTITIKKPNDLLITNKKICGILQEVVSLNSKTFLIIGAGINTNSSPIIKNYKTTSLSSILNKKVNNDKILKEIKKVYENFIQQVKKFSFTELKIKIKKDR